MTKPAMIECRTCLGSRVVMDADTKRPRKCLDCNGEGSVPAQFGRRVILNKPTIRDSMIPDSALREALTCVAMRARWYESRGLNVPTPTLLALNHLCRHFGLRPEDL